jgi:hypothetical protein
MTFSLARNPLGEFSCLVQLCGSALVSEVTVRSAGTEPLAMWRSTLFPLRAIASNEFTRPAIGLQDETDAPPPPTRLYRSVDDDFAAPNADGAGEQLQAVADDFAVGRARAC